MNTDKTFAEQMAAEYALKDTSKVVALRKLDCHAKRPATITAFTLGIASALVMGIGMSLSMGIVGAADTAMMAVGVVIGLIGIAGVTVNYPLYKKLLASGRRKYAADIVRLANEVANQ